MDCGKSISPKPTKRCKSCAGKAPKERRRRAALLRKLHTDPEFKLKQAEGNAAYKAIHCPPPPQRHCCDCGTEIGPQAVRCSPCAGAYRWIEFRDRMLAGVQNPERCLKIAKAAGKNWADGVYDGIPPKMEAHPNWQGGISFEPYGPDFNDALKLQIRTRDAFRCLVCGKPENGTAWDVHHCNYNKKDNSPDNLITLCKSCHGKTGTNRDYWQAYFTGEGYELMLGAC